MKASLAQASLLSVGQLPRQRGEAETPTSNQPPRGDQGHRLLEPTALRICPFALLLSQVRARLGPGGYCRHSGNGSDLPTRSLRRGSSSGPVWPNFISSLSRPSRGAKPHEADDKRPPRERPHQASSRGAE